MIPYSDNYRKRWWFSKSGQKRPMSAKTITGEHGFTLVELVIIIIVLGILAAVAVPKFGAFSRDAKLSTTKEEMIRIKKAIVGDNRLVAGGEYISRGFEGDVGHCPARLADLVVKPDSIPLYDRFSRLGWNGPYLDSAGQKYLHDAWGHPYVYDPASRTISSTSVTPALELSF